MADERFMAHPAEHRRVQVLPVWFEGTAKTDRTLSGETNASARILTEHNPFHYQLTPVFTNVLRQLAATNAEAVLLLDTKAVFQSPHQHVKANRWNYTAGALIAVTEVAANLAALAGSGMGGPVYQPFWIDPFWRPRNSIRHTFAFVDAGSGEVLWFNRQTFEYKDPRAPEILSETVKATLCDLPAHDQPSRRSPASPR